MPPRRPSRLCVPARMHAESPPPATPGRRALCALPAVMESGGPPGAPCAPRQSRRAPPGVRMRRKQNMPVRRSPKGSGVAAALWAFLCSPFRKGKEKAGSAIGAACHVLSFYCVIARCLLPALLPVQTTLQLYPQYRDGDHLNTDLAFFTHP